MELATRTIAAKSVGSVVECPLGSKSCDAGYARSIAWLQGATIAWMLVECAVALFAATRAHSPSLLAFGSDSLVELLSATVVLLQFTPKLRIDANKSARIAGILLFVLAGIVAATAIASLVFHIEPERSFLGIGITIAALIIMPILSAAKHHVAEITGNIALEADSIQSATCAYLAVITLVGLAANAFFHIPWIDSVAALGITPILIIEGRRAIRGESCACC
jgi:divalent metal cation (Fe/Co/Zn/Cd) transporter